MRKASLPKIDRGEITPGATASSWFAQTWAQLRDILEPVARDALRAGDDGSLHSLTLTPAAGDMPTAVVLSGAAIPTSPPTTPAPPPVWTLTQQGDWTARSYDTSSVTGVYKVNGVQVVAKRQTLASPSYAAPAGGTTVDTEGRAALIRLAADVAALRTTLGPTGHGLTT